MSLEKQRTENQQEEDTGLKTREIGNCGMTEWRPDEAK